MEKGLTRGNKNKWKCTTEGNTPLCVYQIDLLPQEAFCQNKIPRHVTQDRHLRRMSVFLTTIYHNLGHVGRQRHFYSEVKAKH